MTIYCNNSDNTAKCPSWVNIALPQTGGTPKVTPNTAGQAATTGSASAPPSTAPGVTYTTRYPDPSPRP